MQEENKPVASVVRRGVYILPNLFTTASLLAGFWAMLLAVAGDVETAALAILFGAFMDGLDGKVARLTNTGSAFGLQYDSLADLVSFGVAPAFLIWNWQLGSYGNVGVGVALLFVACTALRLARFNISTGRKFFTGLSSTAGGCTLALFVLFVPYLPAWMDKALPALSLFVTFAVALLMVSRVRYFAFKEYGFLKTHPFSSLVTALLLFVLLLSEPKLLGFLTAVFYILSGLFYTYVLLPRRSLQLLGNLTQNT